jgi:hypothetical protein
MYKFLQCMPVKAASSAAVGNLEYFGILDIAILNHGVASAGQCAAIGSSLVVTAG